MSKKKTKKRLNFKRTLAFLLFIYIIGYFVYYLINRPIKHFEITGNNIVSEAEILRISKLKDYPSIFKYSSWTIKNNIKKIDFISDVKVTKWFGNVVKIKVTEKRPLFYYETKDKIVLNTGDIINNNNYNIYGIPVLINNTKKEILKEFIEDYDKLNDNIIYEINYIEYYPKYNESGELISDNIFKIVMSDSNTIICNTKTVNVLNKYNYIFASLNGKYGTINLDSNKLSNLVFIQYEE